MKKPDRVPKLEAISPARSERSGQTFPLARRGGKMGTRGRSGNCFSLRARKCRAIDRYIEPITTKSRCTFLRAALHCEWIHREVEEQAVLALGASSAVGRTLSSAGESR